MRSESSRGREDWKKITSKSAALFVAPVCIHSSGLGGGDGGWQPSRRYPLGENSRNKCMHCHGRFFSLARTQTHYLLREDSMPISDPNRYSFNR